ncbi:MFS transporter [Virgisporangium aliadipatigenens]|uniref:MFS transporter n=1 Tax=Virgisporangium aliadipatigenens TaxID=741659 RepID=A0A8J3YGI2_9ACTN|nr:MFS transporter [Virgisporangium aliadipatigenens]GIJ43803.1 MFS transporter [Virgisporangium aliadipatigenens]
MAVVLALSLLFIEFLAGLQRYLSQAVLPLVAAELHGTGLYGPLDAAAQAPMFLMMPVGAWLLSRFTVGRLMVTFTALTVAGAGLCALAPSMPVFIAGTALRALASGALATVGMGAISRGLPPRYRQLVLAGMSGIWVFSSVLGPVYAVAAASAFGWRWAMVLYLPLLVLARVAIARSMPERAEEAGPEQAPWGWSFVLAAGSAVLSFPLGGWSAVAVLAGGGLMLVATRAVLPPGTFGAARGRRAALTALTVTAAVYFGASMVLSVVAHDAFGLGAGRFGFVIAAPGLMWAVAGLWSGSRPASDGAAFRRRMLRGGATIAFGVATLLVTTSAGVPAFGGLLVGAALLGLGMGALYPDLLGRCLSRPEVDDGISEDRMAAAVVLAESVGLALATTAAYTWLGTGLGLVDDPLRRAQTLYALLIPLAALMLHRLTSAARP